MIARTLRRFSLPFTPNGRWLGVARPATIYERPDFTEARATIRTLQTALDRAQTRIRELEPTSAAMAERMAAANERADLAEIYLYGVEHAGATPPESGHSPWPDVP